MRNHSFARSSFLLTMFRGVAGASLLLLCAPALRAQCDDSDSIDCQLQQTAPLPSTIQSPASPAELSMDAPSDQGSPLPDNSSEASADKSLPGGSNYTEQASREKRSAGQQGGRFSAPAPPTEFQLFVAATTGHILPIYGTGLFSQRAAAFGLIDKAPAPENMVVGPGDTAHLGCVVEKRGAVDRLRRTYSSSTTSHCERPQDGGTDAHGGGSSAVGIALSGGGGAGSLRPPFQDQAPV